MERARRVASDPGPDPRRRHGAAIALRRSPRPRSTPARSRSSSRPTSGRASPTSRLPLGRLRADTHGAPLHLRANLDEVDIEWLQEGSGAASTRWPRSSSGTRSTRRAVSPRGSSWSARSARSSSDCSCSGPDGTPSSGRPRPGSSPWSRPSRSRDRLRRVGLPGAELHRLAPAGAAALRSRRGRDRARRLLPRRAPAVVAGAARAYTAVEANPLGRGDEIRVLHISDIHLSTLGYDFAQELARSFDVDLVVDTGDTTSFGASGEEFILSEIPDFGLPYVWVRGNHDARSFQDAIGGLSDVTVLDGDTAEVDGFTIYGLGDPCSSSERGTPTDEQAVEDLMVDASEQVLDDVEALPEPPDIVMVHDDRMAGGVAGPGAARPVRALPREPERGDRRHGVPAGRHDRRRGADRVHGGGRRPVLGRGALLPRGRGGSDGPGGVGRGDAVPGDGQPGHPAAPGASDVGVSPSPATPTRRRARVRPRDRSRRPVAADRRSRSRTTSPGPCSRSDVGPATRRCGSTSAGRCGGRRGRPTARRRCDSMPGRVACGRSRGARAPTWALEQAPELIGAEDDLSQFEPRTT